MNVFRNNIYLADITRCFETISVNGQGMLFEVLKFKTSLEVTNFQRKNPRSTPKIWFKSNESVVTSRVVRASTCLNYRNWHQMSLIRFLILHKCLTTNCYVRLGNKVWKQVSGIPMGFSCSPLWCNPYLMTYETKSIQRLARLGHNTE